MSSSPAPAVSRNSLTSLLLNGSTYPTVLLKRSVNRTLPSEAMAMCRGPPETAVSVMGPVDGSSLPIWLAWNSVNHTILSKGNSHVVGICERLRVRRHQRRTLHSWSFGQLRAFIEYKARLAGVPAVFADPRNASRTCPKCGHVASKTAQLGTGLNVSSAPSLANPTISLPLTSAG